MLSARLQSVSLRDLNLVLAVYRKGALRPVARDMAISASGLSHQVRKVENALNCVLFERGHHAVTPTAAGLKLIQQIERLLLEADTLETMARSTPTPFGGELRMGSNTTVGPYILPYVQRVFQSRYAEVILSLSEGMTAGPYRRLADGEIDVLISCLPPEGREIVSSPLIEEDFLLLYSRKMSLPPGNLAAIAEGFADVPIYLPEDAEVYGQSVDDALAPTLGPKWKQRFPNLIPVGRVSLESIATLASLNGAAALLPSVSVERLSTLPDLHAVQLESPPTRRIYISWRWSTPHAPELEKLTMFLQSELARLGDYRNTNLTRSEPR